MTINARITRSRTCQTWDYAAYYAQKVIDVTFSEPVKRGKLEGKETIIKGIDLDAFVKYTVGFEIADATPQ